MPRRIRRENLPKPGTEYVKSYRGQTIRAKVVSIDPLKNRVSIEVNGVHYPSPSAAAKALTGHDVNGWVFWGIETRTK